MKRKALISITLLTPVLLLMASCASRQVISTADEMDAFLRGIDVGEAGYVEVVGLIRPYSGSFPKGRGLSEMAVGEKVILIHSSVPLSMEEMHRYLNKTVTARIEVSHFPLADSHPASQIGGRWITGIKDIEEAN